MGIRNTIFWNGSKIRLMEECAWTGEHVMSEFKQEIATTLQDYRNHITSHILERSEQLEFWVKSGDE